MCLSNKLATEVLPVGMIFISYRTFCSHSTAYFLCKIFQLSKLKGEDIRRRKTSLQAISEIMQIRPEVNTVHLCSGKRTQAFHSISYLSNSTVGISKLFLCKAPDSK
jgi:hypothetical protein